ncbi:McrC family protein [Natrinema salsiterrestre]|uniref:McrC family protein n=1 Tax=Natrinema salsiterrestre TaxID=2950540 RepID=A0A9Q4L8Z7_9EURY|nr:hypothetical protein [Natrinema salsiterrestre]MDF9748220.1 McrC family protein [Natrinema salsiterrestre]
MASTEQGPLRTIELAEHETSHPLDLPEAVLETIDSKLNRSKHRLTYEYTADGQVRLRTSSYVGLVSLPEGTQVRIRPKAAGGNFLRLLLYAQGASSATIDSTVEALSGDLFLDAIGALFLERLEELIQRGLGKDYRTQESRESHLRGRLDVQRQLSRGDVVTTQFDVEYQELTHDTVPNQAVLYATHLLTQLVDEQSLQGSLRQREQQLRRDVTLRPVPLSELDAVHLDRRTQYYEDILRLAELVIQSTFVDNFRSGTRETYGMLVNMNRIFEATVERAACDALEGTAWTMDAQSRLDRLVTGGNPSINMYPDFVISDPNGNLELVGDAKWKTGRPSQSDIYQLTSYQLADDVPGLLLYPSQDGSVETEYRVDDRLPLHLRELPTGADVSNFSSFANRLSDVLKQELEAVGMNIS